MKKLFFCFAKIQKKSLEVSASKTITNFVINNNCLVTLKNHRNDNHNYFEIFWLISNDDTIVISCLKKQPIYAYLYLGSKSYGNKVIAYKIENENFDSAINLSYFAELNKKN